jgi:hypothetical protein
VTTEAPVVLVSPDETLETALEDAEDAAFEPLRRSTLDASHDTVTVQRLGQARGRDEDTLLASGLSFGSDEPVASRGAGEPPHDEVQSIGKPNASAPQADDRPVREKPAQGSIEVRPLVGVQLEPPVQLAKGEGATLPLQEVENASIEGCGVQSEAPHS